MSWREYLTEDERRTIDAADAAKAEWQRLNAPRAGIINRAIKRAGYRRVQSEATITDASQPNGMTKTTPGKEAGT